MKKIIVAIISFVLLIIVLGLIINIFSNDDYIYDDDKLVIVATLFPEYDFAKQIVGDKANVRLLINSGVETHNYEPTAKDMINLVDNTDMFISTGITLEPWTEKIVKNLEQTDCKIVDLSKGISLIEVEEFEERFLNNEIYNKEEDNHDELYDEHVWLNTENAKIMINQIVDEICTIDPDNKDYYMSNADDYIKKIDRLAERLNNCVNTSSKKVLAFGGEFSYAYLVDQYDLNFVSVYLNCGEGEDPSIERVKSVIDYINNHELDVVYYQELSNGTIAKMIAEETDTTPLVLYSIHNGNPDEDTYVSLFEKNIESLEKGLN